jgi:NitT/TauT family transport system substrate-binding protein
MKAPLRVPSAIAVLALLTGCGGSAAAPASSVAPSARASAPAASAAASAKASAAAGAIPTIPADKPVSITIATGVPSASFTGIWIALDKGYFKDHGLDVQHERLEGVVQSNAIMADEVQIGTVGGTEILDTRVGGSDLVAIQQGTESPTFEIHAPKSITNLDDLKGKTLAFTRPGSSTDLATRVILANHHLQAGTDVKLLAANNMPGILAALETGKVQAGTMSPPTTIKADQAGFPKLAGALDEHVALQQGLIVVRKSYADAHPAVVYAYLEALMEGVRDFFNTPQVAIDAIAKYTKSDQKTAKEAYDAMKPALDPVGIVDPAGFVTVQKYGKNTKTRELNVNDAIDNHFMQALKDSGFIAKLGIKASPLPKAK